MYSILSALHGNQKQQTIPIPAMSPYAETFGWSSCYTNRSFLDMGEVKIQNAEKQK